MLFDVFTRLFYALTLFSPKPESSPSSPNGSLVISPSNLSIIHLFDWLDENDTVVMENPNLEYENGEVGEQEGKWMITLPLCSGFIDSDGYYITPNKSSLLDMDQLGYYWYPAPHLFPSENRSHYMFQVHKPTCPTTLKLLTLSMDEFDVVGNSQGRFLRNGYFGYNNIEFYSPQEYCINKLNAEYAKVLLCESQAEDCTTEPWNNPEGKRPCLQKCCNPDEIYSFSRKACIKSSTGALFHPTFYHHLSSKLSSSEQHSSLLPHYYIKFPRSFKYRCENNLTLPIPASHFFAQQLSNLTQRDFNSLQFKIRKDGKIMYRKDWKAVVMPDQDLPTYLPEQNKKCYTLQSTPYYCIDGAAEYGNSNPFGNEEGEMFLVTCSEYLFEPPKIGPLSFVYGNVMIASSVFSLLTVIVYSILKEKQNIHGWTIASYAGSIFFMYIFLGLAHLIRYYGSDDVLKTTSCVTVGIASHLFSLASFIWLFLINWDIWWTFRNIRPTRNTMCHLQRNREIRQFLAYSAVGWGVPVIIMGVTTFLHFKYEDAAENNCAIVNAPLPAYGRESCEIKQLSLGVYLYFPAAFLLACNLLFFGVTMYTLCQHSRTTQVATKNMERHRQSFQLFAKLFFVMGVTRVFEVITWAESGPTLTWYWAVFDIFNILQAVAIFIIYVCKRDVFLSLKKLFMRRLFGAESIRRHSEKKSRASKARSKSRQSDQRSMYMSMIENTSTATIMPLMILPNGKSDDQGFVLPQSNGNITEQI